ncbi:MAG: TPM domain-containing protein [Nitrospira sp.]|nr:TPM domain-containing protein [Nitrospira sp.]MCP9441707.1 TPM domain-containing protein [Nitrospira sp.]
METGKRLELTAEEQELITSAVRRAERQTNAEIVPMIVIRSGLYRDVQYRTGLLMALFVLAVSLTMEPLWLPWGWSASNAGWLVSAVVVGYVGGAFLGRWPPVIRLMTSRERMNQKVGLRAERAFVHHAVGQTRDRTGVLIMLSLLERSIYVLPDRSLADLVPPERWSDVVQASIQHLHEGQIVVGLCDAIEACGALLAQVCPSRPGDNPNELPDHVIQEP